jgi:hypothetical protein
MLDVYVDSIEDINVREAFRELLDALQQSPFLKGKWTFKEVTVGASVANKRVPHNLGFKPKDAVVISKSGTADVFFNFDEFDETYVDFTTSDATTVRFWVGTYNEEQ